MITSKDNQHVKHARALLTQTKARKESNQFVIENERFILDTNPKLIDTILYKSLPPSLETFCETNTIPTLEIQDNIFDTIPSVKTSFGALAIVNQPTPVVPKTFKTALYLDGINTPSNLGAIIRNATAFNSDIIFLSPESCDPFHPESVRASAGLVTTIPIITLPFSELPNATIYGLDSNSTNILTEVSFKSPCILAFGSETGLTVNIPEENKLKIPMNPNIDSLNVAVSTGIVLSQAFQK